MGIYQAADVTSVRDLYTGLIEPESWSLGTVDHLAKMASRLKSGYENGHPGAMVELSNWSPGVPRDPVSEFGDTLELDLARLAIAREHGWARWDLVQDTQPDLLFEEAVESILDGDADNLRALLERTPALTTLRSHFAHRATLLHYCAANGVETHRQRVPDNLPELVGTLIQGGADRDALGFFYGTDMNFIGLLTSSEHPARAGVTERVASVLHSSNN